MSFAQWQFLASSGSVLKMRVYSSKTSELGKCVVGLKGLGTSCLNDTAGAGGQMKALIASSHLLCMAQEEQVRQHNCEQRQPVRRFESWVP